ncbi:hypothetical protein EOD39_5177 [Acipenser ruthenus]|uniref:Uncharacterized protein n=1 Tax=Acipenser ruthenus TaxID=7906 RepID=A0A444TW69_ACIRT|nr:hypothetical protein EOD39_5177 [Acipenser ruthenus]
MGKQPEEVVAIEEKGGTSGMGAHKKKPSSGKPVDGSATVVRDYLIPKTGAFTRGSRSSPKAVCAIGVPGKLDPFFGQMVQGPGDLCKALHKTAIKRRQAYDAPLSQSATLAGSAAMLSAPTMCQRVHFFPQQVALPQVELQACSSVPEPDLQALSPQHGSDLAGHSAEWCPVFQQSATSFRKDPGSQDRNGGTIINQGFALDPIEEAGCVQAVTLTDTAHHCHSVAPVVLEGARRKVVE